MERKQWISHEAIKLGVENFAKRFLYKDKGFIDGVLDSILEAQDELIKKKGSE